MSACCSLFESILNLNGEELDIPSKGKCFHCWTVKDLKQLLKCSGFQIAIYCNIDCQKRDYSSRHKPICQGIAKKQATYESMLKMHEQADGKKYLNEGKLVGKLYCETKGININGHSIPAPQFMIKERFDQRWEMYTEALTFDSIAGIEKVLKGVLEIFRCIFLFEPIGLRYFVPILLLQSGRVADAYNLTKFLMFNYTNNSDEDLKVLVNQKDWLASLPKYDTTEGIFDEKLLGKNISWVEAATGGFFADNLYIVILIGVKFEMTAKKRKDFGHVSSCSCNDCTDDTLVDQTMESMKLLMKRSSKMVKNLIEGKRGGSSPLGPMSMDWGFDLAEPYPKFKDIGKCYVSYFRKFPIIKGICRGNQGILSYDYPKFQDDNEDLNIPHLQFTLL